MPKFTIFTTTYRRPHLLRRLYRSLCAQTNKDFVWLVVNDEQDGETEKVIHECQAEDLISINFVQQPHQGKTAAMLKGFQLVETPYMIDIDDDDELMPNAVETFMQAWKDIETKGLRHIGMVCALSQNEKGTKLKPKRASEDGIFWDTDYTKQEWTRHDPFEAIISRRTDVIRDLTLFDDQGKWLRDQVTLVLESVYWNRVARHWDSRYLNTVLRIYHEESPQRQSVEKFAEQKCINYVFSLYVLLNELKGKYFENPKQTIKYTAEYMACGFASKYPMKQLLRVLESDTVKNLAVVISPFAWVVGSYFRCKNFQNGKEKNVNEQNKYK
ncbi:MAG: glycosyltransferase [Prevotella sp.]|nr:glycosyltransferase [Prevotella sp.]